jgi:hypothetical protein
VFATAAGLVAVCATWCYWLFCNTLFFRYQRGQRSLLKNLQPGSSTEPTWTGVQTVDADSDDFADITEDIEELLDFLLTSLKVRTIGAAFVGSWFFFSKEINIDNNKKHGQ